MFLHSDKKNFTRVSSVRKFRLFDEYRFYGCLWVDFLILLFFVTLRIFLSITLKQCNGKISSFSVCLHILIVSLYPTAFSLVLERLDLSVFSKMTPIVLSLFI